MSHLTETIQTDARTEARLLRLLDLPAAWLYELQYANGLAWLEKHYGYDPRPVRALATMPPAPGAAHNLYWAWWLNAWRGLDAVLSQRLTVLPATGSACYKNPAERPVLIHHAQELELFYRAAHNPATMDRQLPDFVRDAARRYQGQALPED